MILSIFFLFFVCCIVSIVSINGAQRKYVALFWILSVVLVAILMCRNEDTVRDYGLYVDYYDNDVESYSVEYSFVLICHFVKIVFGNVSLVFFSYALLSILLKFLAIKKLFRFYFLPIVVFMGNYMILHEFTQMRAGVSVSFLLLSIPSIYNRSLKSFLFYIGMAAFFHYSALVALPIYLLKAKSINKKYWISVLFVGLILFYVKFDYLQLFSISEYFYVKMSGYMQFPENFISIFNVFYIIKIVLYLVFLLKSDLIAKSNKYAYLMIKIYGISLFIYSAFSAIPIISVRCSELFGIVEIIVISFLFYIMSSKKYAVFGICLYSVTILIYRIYVNELILS